MSKLGMPGFSKKKILLLGFLLLMLLIIPLTVYLVQQQQQTQSRAEKSTTMSFSPAEQTASIGGTVTFDVWVSPGQNQVNFIKLVLKYDSTKLVATESSFVLNPASNMSILQNPAIGASGDELSVVLNQGDPTKVIREDTKIGTVTFDVIGISDVPSQVSFDPNQMQVRSIGDAFTENVFLSGTPASVTIQEGDIAPTPTATPSATPSPEPSPTEEITPTATQSGDITPSNNQSPVCQSLALDQSATGAVPYTLTFTATGTDTDGTISKVGFNFGDGPVTDVTTDGGIGTASVSLDQAHTYASAGVFTASAVLTDDGSAVSDSTSCTTTITVTGTDTATPSATPLPPTGPNNAIVGIGALGGIIFLIGALLFFVL